jgi:hypothetical protein
MITICATRLDIWVTATKITKGLLRYLERSYGMVYIQMEVTWKGINEVDTVIQLRKHVSETNLII